jgi:UDP-N-acetyl-alpha-D-muramoyl-L-alanyl-L-glutamate epimerase
MNKKTKAVAAKAKQFRFSACRFVPETASAHFEYAADKHRFEERIVFKDAPKDLSNKRIAAIDHLLHYLHLAAGISYYKAFVPPEIIVETRPLSKRAAAFFDDFYLHGLGEFAYANLLDLRGHIHFAHASGSAAFNQKLLLGRKTAVPIGGGKDSVVSLEILKKAREPLIGLAVGGHSTIDAVAAVSKVPLYRIERHLSANLFELNQKGVFNGHVPVTGILSFIFLIAAVVYDFDAIAMSNERSANVGNLEFNGLDINHQWSKSEHFETRLRELMASEGGLGIDYFSLLRPFSELKIASLFADQTGYHDYFASCNRGFKITQKTEKKWCCNCDKCRFVFLILAPFLTPAAMLKIFGRNLFDDMSQHLGFETLLGLKEHKPFECVGELEEAQVALNLIAGHKKWRKMPMVKSLAVQVADKFGEGPKALKDALSVRHSSWMTRRFKKAIDAFEIYKK